MFSHFLCICYGLSSYDNNPVQEIRVSSRLLQRNRKLGSDYLCSLIHSQTVFSANFTFTVLENKSLENVDLEQRRIFRLFVVLLGCVLPRYPEHSFVLILPAKSFIFPTLYLDYEPLFQVQLSPVIHLQNILCLRRTKFHFQMSETCAQLTQHSLITFPPCKLEKHQYFLSRCRPSFLCDVKYGTIDQKHTKNVSI